MKKKMIKKKKDIIGSKKIIWKLEDDNKKWYKFKLKI